MSFIFSSRFDYHLRSSEQDQVERLVPLHQAKIHIAFRANVKYNTKRYDNAAVALSEHMVTICNRGFFGRSFRVLTTFHVFDITSITTKNDHTVLIDTISSHFIIKSPAAIRFTRNLIRNFILSNPMMPPVLRFPFKTHNSNEFPVFNPPLSPSQKFQFTYNANCSYYNVTYYHDIPRYFHKLMQAGNGVFDFTQLPIHLMECGLGMSTDIRPITASIMFDPFVQGINCSDITRSDIVLAIASPILMNPCLKMVRIVESGAEEGCAQIANAMLQALNPGVVYWDFSSNKMIDISFFVDALSSYRAPLLSLRLNNCGLTTLDITTLLSSLTDNPNTHGIQQLALVGNRFNKANCDQFFEYILSISSIENDDVNNFRNDLNRNSNRNRNKDNNGDGANELDDVSSDNDVESLSDGGGNEENVIKYLTRLELGPLDKPIAIIEGLSLSGQPISILKIIDSKFDDQSTNLLAKYLHESKTLNDLDISGCSFNEKQLLLVLDSVLTNNNLNEIKLSLCRLSIHGQRYSSVMETLAKKAEKIIELTLNQNGLTLNDPIMNDLQKFTCLRHLSLSCNYTKRMTGIGGKLAILLQYANLKSLYISGDRESYSLNNEIIPLITALHMNRTLEEIDISGNSIGDIGLKAVNSMLRANSSLKIIKIDDSCPTTLPPILDFLDIIGKSQQFVEASFPVNDVYYILCNIDRASQLKFFEIVSQKRQIAQLTLTKNQANAGMFSGLSLLKDEILNLLLDSITLEMQQRMNQVIIGEHSAITEVVGLPLPFEQEYQHIDSPVFTENVENIDNNDIVRQNIANVSTETNVSLENEENEEEIYASKNQLETVFESNEANDRDFETETYNMRTLQFNSLIIRRPDAEQRLEEKGKFLLMDSFASFLSPPSQFDSGSIEEEDESNNETNGKANEETGDETTETSEATDTNLADVLKPSGINIEMIDENQNVENVNNYNYGDEIELPDIPQNN
ncbi:hypothetical protein TRFO_37346 [Tritrichomonas foetus]|uniref:Leucine Rich Repeat family protein n=1 Tax=Tritrichomonas foetus TaxID=1144522 RepID=A0A1J4JFP5_9EUKA|nr:hypothetical protein TRFO_37346 [Tritrichomonas foetus]|eukprot:OHS96459.1 hypothetical protein TRFO_37346 [Tritrichomonas foetus]